jgi:hypothetical protein
MRRMSLLFIASVAAGTLAAQTPPVHAPQASTGEDAQPELIRTVAIHSGDSPLVQAAKKAVAARQNSKSRIKINDRTVRGAGHVSQGTGPAVVSMNLPPAPSYAPPPGADPADVARQKELAAKIEALKQEQERMAAEADEPYGGDVEEDRVDQRQSQIPQEIDQLQRQQTPSRPPR